MKKIYLLAMMTAVGTMSFAQSSQKQMQKINFSKSTAKSPAVYEKAPGQVIWSSDFSTQADWTIGGDGAQGDWDMGTNTDVPDATGYMGDMASTTFANGFGFFDGVTFLIGGSVDPQNAWLEMTNPIDLSGETNVIFSFEQRYRAFNTDITYVEVSVDNGATWTGAIDVNEDVVTNDPATQNTVYQAFEVNGATQVKFRFRWENLSDDDLYGSGYGWFVDDVNVTTLPDNDIDASDLYYGTEGLFYYQIPENQIAPIDFSVIARNAGINEQTGVALEATETGGSGYVGTSNTETIPAETSDSLVVSSAFTPPGQGTYDLEFNILNDSVDDVPLNNELGTYSFDVVDWIYARDNGNNSGANDNGGNEPFELGNLFDIWQNQDLYAVNIGIGANCVEGINVLGKVYSIDDQGEFAYEGETESHTIVASDLGTELKLAFDAPLQLEANETYLVVAQSFEDGLAVTVGGTSDPQTSFLYEISSDTWFYTTSTPRVRMNFDPSSSTKENSFENLNVSQNYPNPFSDETTVKYSLENASEVSYTLVDLTGKTILDVNEGNVSAGNHSIKVDGSSLASGVYYFNMNAGDTQVTHKMIVNK
ncbi:MAG: T9SS type A sorting domain-containing protein [Brumimicrobium sp.]